MNMLIGIIILLYLIISFMTYKFIVSKWKHPMWEKVMISLSWICVIPLWIIKKIQMAFQ